MFVSNASKTSYAHSSKSSSNGATSLAGKLAEVKKRKNEQLKNEIEQQRQQYSYNPQPKCDAFCEDQFQDDWATIAYNLVVTSLPSYEVGTRHEDVKGSLDSKKVEYAKNKSKIKDVNYDSSLGQKIAQDVASHSVGFTGRCSKYVRQSLERVGVSNGHTGSAADMDSVLKDNKHFKEIDVNSVDLNSLPAGCILVYERGAAGYNKTHGHIEVTLGDGTACSDGRTNHIRRTEAGQMHVFVPVSA